MKTPLGNIGDGSSTPSEFILGYARNQALTDNALSYASPFSSDLWSTAFNLRRTVMPRDVTLKNLIIDWDTNTGNIVGVKFTLRIRSLAGVWSSTALTVTSLLNSIAQLEVIADVNVDKGEAIQVEADNLTNTGTSIPESYSLRCVER